MFKAVAYKIIIFKIVFFFGKRFDLNHILSSQPDIRQVMVGTPVLEQKVVAMMTVEMVFPDGLRNNKGVPNQDKQKKGT